MYIEKQEAEKLQSLCRRFRIDVLDVLHEKQTGHPGGSLSVCEILTTLYFHTAKLDPAHPDWPERDRIVLSKGHAAPMLYRVLAERGYFPVAQMHTLRDFDTRLQGHPCALTTPGVEISTGPLGIGLAASLGIALSLKLDGSKARVYAVLGDGELDEGGVWEAVMAAAKYKADNLTAIVDWNGVQLDGANDDIMPLGDLRAKFAAFGWHVAECDGHDVSGLCEAYDKARCEGKPSVVLAHTIKGKGVSFMEGRNAWHGKAIGDAEFAQAMKELGVEA
ncbi:MAG: transketolase [Clostridia bacterium]|nr:transketolase [Clostridia bacterium]